MAEESNPKQPTPAEEPQPDASPAEMAEQALENADEAVAAIADEAESGPVLPDFASGPEDTSDATGIALLSDVNLHVQIELGRTRMVVEDVLRLGPGSVIELDKAAGDPVDIFVNERHVARGEVLVVNENFCVRVSEIIDQRTEAAQPAATESSA